ncbi:unnamed protein product [Ixodes hexagonus]
MDARKLIAHPSVRVRGSENIFEPTVCTSVKCPPEKGLHFHCPFCGKGVIFKDARIVKAHYRVKHVDKGLCFAGLKMLRCSATCRMWGAIKGEKKFRGPHWHCYKCRNGFCRRDEAMKHYETHFKLPQTTFQINIVQDVNEGMGIQIQADKDSTMELSDGMISSSSGLDPEADCTEAVSVTVDMTEDTSSEHHLSPDLSGAPTSFMVVHEEDAKSLSSDPGSLEDLTVRNTFLEKLVTEFKQQLDNLKAKRAETENVLRAEIYRLQRQLEVKNVELELLRKRERELTSQKPSFTGTVDKLLKNLQSQHTELLQQHIAQARNEALQCALKELQNGTTILTTVDNSAATMVQQDNSSLVAMVLDSSGTLIPVSLATTAGSSVMCCPPAKTMVQKQRNPLVLSNTQTFVPQPKTVQQPAGTQHLVLTLADIGDIPQDLVPSTSRGNTMVTCSDLQYRLATVAGDGKDEQEVIEGNVT